MRIRGREFSRRHITYRKWQECKYVGTALFLNELVVKHSSNDTILCTLDNLYLSLGSTYFSKKKNNPFYVSVFLLYTEILGTKSCVFFFLLHRNSSSQSICYCQALSCSINSLHSHNSPMKWVLLVSPLYGWGKEAQRGWITCSRSQSLLVVDPGFTPRQFGSRVCVLKHSTHFLFSAVLALQIVCAQ